MDAHFSLEFDKILSNIASLASAEPVKTCILGTTPTADIEVAQRSLTRTGDAITVLASHRPDLYFYEINTIIAKAKVGATLSPKEFLEIYTNIRALRSLKSCVENTDGCDSLKDITAYARTCDELEHDIDVSIENETDIKDSASEKLYSIRKSIVRAGAALKSKLDSYTRQNEVSKYLRDNIVTMRGGRYVLPVRSDCRGYVKGLVHDVSATGATVFIEPFAIVEANNEIITLQNAEHNEIERILAELSKKVVSFADELTVGQEVLTECGVIFAKAEYAKQQNAYRPVLNDDGKIELRGARHPLIDKFSVVPIDLSMNGKRVLVISGPNTGGKTVALKIVGLFAYMSASGIFLPAFDGSEMSIFDKIYCDIGDSQSIAQSLSTFSAHITNLAEITDTMNARSLVLLDEVGDGTDPDEGAALAVAVIKKLLSTRTAAVVTTHFNSVKEFALGCDEVANACMQFDNVNFKPTYKVLQGVSGSSYALEIAERLGLSSEIISTARAALSGEKIAFDTIIKQAEKMRNETLTEKQRYEKLCAQAAENEQRSEKLKTEYEAKLAEIKENSRAMIKRQAAEYTERAEQIIEQIKENIRFADEAALFRARKQAKQLERDVPNEEVKPSAATRPAKADDLTVGTSVFVSGLEKFGTIASLPRGNKVSVAIGSIKTDVPVSSVSLIVEERRTEPRKIERQAREPENREIMLLGKTVDEATQEIDVLLSDIAPRSTVRLVHGKGTGALGKGIQAYLRHHKRVKSFRYGRYGEGDTGVTIVEIK